MKYPWLGMTITLIWLMATFTVLNDKGTNPTAVLGIALIATALLSFLGFRPSK